MVPRFISALLVATLTACISPPGDVPDSGEDTSSPSDTDASRDSGELEDGSEDTGTDTTTDTDTAFDSGRDADTGPNNLLSEQEPNDGPSGALTVSPPQNFSGTTDPLSSDWWAVEIAEAPTLLELRQVRLESADGEPRDDSLDVTLIPADDSVEEREYNTKDGQFRTFYIPTGGTWYLEVDEDGDLPVYEFSVDELDLPEVIDGGTELMWSGDLTDFKPDIYEYVAPREASVTVTVSSLSGDLDPYLFVQSRSGVQLHSEHDSNLPSASIDFGVAQGERIWLIATGYNMPASGSSYELLIAD